MERTFVMVKPDGVRRGLVGEIIRRFEARGLTIAELKLIRAPRALAEEHYGVHRDKPFFQGVVEFITSGPVVAMILEGENAVTAVRQIMGATRPLEAAPGTLRADYCLDVQENLVHGSDSPETAAQEIRLWFGIMNTGRSRALYQRAVKLMPGGVNSPVRAFKSVGGEPRFIREARGSHMIDADGNDYVDYVGSWGPMILGHAHPQVVAAVQEAVGRGTSYGASTELEVELAERITRAFPAIERVRLVNSGTEAVMSAVRLARAFTGRSRVLKFEGCYHGHADGFLARAGSGLATLGIPDTPGVPAEYAALTLTVPYNDLDAAVEAFRQHPDDLAVVVVEPIAGNMGVVPPAPGFLEGLRTLTEAHGALLLFDEVITGFRVAYGGVQTLTGARPDLTTLGKIIGGGFPLAAYGGRREIMEKIAPEGPVYQAGTLSGNPVAVTAGLTTLAILEATQPYPELERRAARLEAGLRGAAEAAGVPAAINRAGSMLTAFFTPGPVTDYTSARLSDTERYGRFFRAMLARGVYLAPSQFEAAFVSTAHTDAEIDATIAAAREGMMA